MSIQLLQESKCAFANQAYVELPVIIYEGLAFTVKTEYGFLNIIG